MENNKNPIFGLTNNKNTRRLHLLLHESVDGYDSESEDDSYGITIKQEVCDFEAEENYDFETIEEQPIKEEPSEDIDIKPVVAEEVSENESSEESDLDQDFDTILGKDKTTEWQTRAPARNRKKMAKYVSYLPGVNEEARNAKTPLACWELMFDERMMDLITKSTNHQIELIKERYKRERDATKTDEIEIKALIGLLYLMGAKHHGRSCTKEIWTSDMTGEELCRNVMGEKRFKFLLQHISFDNVETRAERALEDNLAPIRDIFEYFISNAQRHYTVGEYTTVTEKLEAFRGKCPFRQYIPSYNSAKCGIKIFSMTDSLTCYTQSMEINTGKQPPGPYKLSMLPQDVVLRMSMPNYGTGRNITMGNRFTSNPLAEKLLTHGLTIVGAMNKSRIELPKSFGKTTDRELYSSEFLFNKNKTVVSYKSKIDEPDILLSTMHHDAAIDSSTGDLKKPEIYTFYDATKSGVDKLCAVYNVARNTRKWPMIVFYVLLNVAGINSLVIFTENLGEGHNTRRSFLKSLALEMTALQIKRRSYVKYLPKALSFQIKKFSNISPTQELTETPEPCTSRKRKRCGGCDRSANRMTAHQCDKCGTFICLKDHAKFVCKQCFNGIEKSCEMQLVACKSEESL